jgi:hypothetical protein
MRPAPTGCSHSSQCCSLATCHLAFQCNVVAIDECRNEGCEMILFYNWKHGVRESMLRWGGFS